MKLVVNGKVRTCKGKSCGDLLRELKIHPKAVAVEINGDVLKNRGFDQMMLKENDTVEIVRFMAGG